MSDTRRRILPATLLALLLLPQQHAARAGDPPSPGPAAAAVAGRLETLLAGVPKGTSVGLVVADADTGHTWFAQDAHTPLKPASLQKLVVTAAALERLGADFTYTTRVYIHGDQLWIVGAGDPALGDATLAERHGRELEHVFDDWADALHAAGLSTLSKVVLDDTIFDRQGRHPDWPDDQADRWYQAPVGGLNINDNCLDVVVNVRDRRPKLLLQPDLPPEMIENGLQIGSRQQPVLKRRPDSDHFELSGTVARSGQLDPVAARHPTVFFGHALHRALTKRGIVIRGSVVRRRITTTEQSAAKLVAEHRTPLRDVIWRCNNFSQNLFAECLMKSLAAYGPGGERSGVAGSWDAARPILLHTLREVGVDLSGASLRDGSGLSHSNRLSARQLVDLLIRMRRHEHADMFITSLAEPARPGSIRTRYDDPALRGRLRAKTGTISGVRCLAGYLSRPDGHTLAFALLINGTAPRSMPRQVCMSLLN